MKRMVFLGATVLLLLTGGVLLVIQSQNDTASQQGTLDNSELKTEGNDMDTIIAALPADDQEYIQGLKDDIRDAKADGDEEWAVELEKDLKEEFQRILNPIQYPDAGDHHESVRRYEQDIKIAKEEGGSEQFISGLEEMRDLHLKFIAEDEVREREQQADMARFEALSTPQEYITYYEEQLLEDEEKLRLAKEKGNPSDIRMKESFVKSAKLSIDYYKSQLAWLPVQKRIDERLRHWEEVKEPQIIAKYRAYLHVEVVDGKEEVVGVRPHEEIVQILRDEMMPAGDVDTVPSVPTTPDPSRGSHLPESQPSSDEMVSPVPATPDKSMDSIIKAQTSFRSWRSGIDQDYVDVLVSRYMSAEELIVVSIITCTHL